MQSLNIAVIGSGISGLSAAWLLSQKHDVTLFESDRRLGGHSHTVDIRLKNGAKLPVDTGFIVSNTWTYPNFTALLDYLDVSQIETKMSFSVSSQADSFQYSGDNLSTLLGPYRQWLSPRQWQLVSDLVRFYKTVQARLPSQPLDVTLGQYLEQSGYSRMFIERHILPIAGAIWSSGPEAIAQYPLHAFVKFFANHKLFDLGDRPSWRTVKGGSINYVNRLVEDGKFAVIMGCPIQSIARRYRSVEVMGVDGTVRSFDHVVVATHGDQALRLLSDPSPDERDLLGVFKTSLNKAILHRDVSLMPSNKRFWAAWNYHLAGAPGELAAVTYWMNTLQKLDSDEQHFVSLNPPREPATESVDRVLHYRHPIFTPETLVAQKELWSLQGQNRTWFAGAWFGAGFHEDGLQAGLAVAEQLGGSRRPWSVAEESGRITVKPVLPVPEPAFLQAAE